LASVFHPGGFAQQGPGPVSVRRQHPPGAGRADGGDIGAVGSSQHTGGPRFDCPVTSGGYAWWYVDALSEDGTQGLTLIAFVGSVFSPYYAWARRSRTPQAEDHCAFNIALYGGANRWSMTERGHSQVTRDASSLRIGPSSMRWTGQVLEMCVDEIGAPIPQRIRGSIRLRPSILQQRSFALDERGMHQWTPYAPCARIEVDLTHPRLRWQGVGYWDSNSGAEPLENAFQSWTWSRASWHDKTVVLYDLQARSAPARSMALHFSADGSARDIELPPAAALRTSGWRVPRSTRADAGFAPSVQKTFEDAPFYSRSLLDTHLLGEPVSAIHESLSLDRFASRWVQCLLPFRMPRVAGN
jgi:carotenoid 1,2-hydratase